MKASFLNTALLVAGISFLASCRKEVSAFATEHSFDNKVSSTQKKLKEHRFKGTMYSYAWVIPDYDHGATNQFPYPAFSTSEGEGTLSLLGKFRSYANWYVYFDADGRLLSRTLPLTNDQYDQLRQYFTAEEVQAMKNANIEDIAFDLQGNSIWSINGLSANTPVPGNATRLEVEGSKTINGGTGKFTGATGSYTYHGYLDGVVPQNPGDPSATSWIELEGRMEY